MWGFGDDNSAKGVTGPFKYQRGPGRHRKDQSCITDWLWVTWHILQMAGEGNGNPLQCYCLENPRDRGAWWAAISGVAQSRTQLKWLSSSSSRFIIVKLFRWMWPIKSVLWGRRKPQKYWFIKISWELWGLCAGYKQLSHQVRQLTVGQLEAKVEACWGPGRQSISHSLLLFGP